ncbi:hypothetical protein U5922_004565 [Aquicoccus sp. G2-2]|uniref:hypothetical protein n=1 Tax=Aquicoccus sp. G2-2 TaxID=3092120 RepID=UPI002AE03FE8|nr:hypothetical protein [Aquicoccus sp. G2-2]MEA1112783.1 hypothetical protein [Aquicoccus sp. G2-2]
MYGVVLWSDKEDHKAVIWCEDHGDLAYYSASGESAFDGVSLDAGDLVLFNLSEGKNVRVATNPQLVAQQQFSGLADSICGADSAKAMPSEGQNNVVQFAPRGRERLAS